MFGVMEVWQKDGFPKSDIIKRSEKKRNKLNRMYDYNSFSEENCEFIIFCDALNL